MKPGRGKGGISETFEKGVQTFQVYSSTRTPSGGLRPVFSNVITLFPPPFPRFYRFPYMPSLLLSPLLIPLLLHPSCFSCYCRYYFSYLSLSLSRGSHSVFPFSFFAVPFVCPFSPPSPLLFVLSSRFSIQNDLKTTRGVETFSVAGRRKRRRTPNRTFYKSKTKFGRRKKERRNRLVSCSLMQGQSRACMARGALQTS